METRLRAAVITPVVSSRGVFTRELIDAGSILTENGDDISNERQERPIIVTFVQLPFDLSSS